MTDIEEIVEMRDIIDLHAIGMNRYTPSASIDPPRPGCIEGAIGNARTAREYMGDEEWDASLVFASHLLFYLANNHCFGDGNKRAAWISCMEVLRKCGLTVDVSDDEAESFMNGVVSDGEGRRRYNTGIAVAKWLANRLTGAKKSR
jgi:prophage maintenance system killer protein